jgi:two-component system cell cycle sensor histidine kinase/response regulator CckA
MPKGGTLVIETANAVLDDEFARQHIEARPGDYAMLSVTDSGVGMDAATLNLIFEPFFSTKGQLGSGLGLATVHGIVQQSGGYILPSSEIGRGTTFKIYLPHNETACQVAELPPQPIPARSRGETVLVVEDAEAVRKLVVNLLARRGHQVLYAGSAEEALQVVASQAGTIDLVITDVVLPGMSGPELATQLATDRPGLAVLYMSGHTDHAIFNNSVLVPGVDFIAKPFSLDGMARKVEDMLARRERV